MTILCNLLIVAVFLGCLYYISNVSPLIVERLKNVLCRIL